MNGIWKELAMTVIMALAVPWVILGLAPTPPTQIEITPQQPTGSTQAAETQGSPEPVCYVQVLVDGQLQEMEMDTYLTGVLLCELPGSFHQEAKKAQAVVARTYAMKVTGDGARHGGAICDRSGCCQGYISREDYLKKGGTEDHVEAAARAVSMTANEVLTYNARLIEATYFSCSGGMTEDAVAVWGSDIPYLQAVESPGEEIASHYTDCVTFNGAEFQRKLGVQLKGSPSSWFGKTTYTDGDGVATMVIGGRTYKGTELRKKLGLRSTSFTLTAIGNSVIITTKGYGHRVGMSQYGAQAMALEGSGYADILAHYYQGVTLSQAQ